MVFDELRSDVFSFLQELVDSASPSTGHRRMLRLHLEEMETEIVSDAVFGPIDMPALVHGTVAPGRPPPVAVAGACTLLYLGADLLDNVADRELSTRWLEEGADAATLTAATYLSSLTYLALDRHPGAPAQRHELMSALATALSAMSAGQHGDLCNRAIDPRDSVIHTELKSGAEFGFFMRAGAIAAGAGPPLPDRFSEIGIAFGTATQLASDIYDTFRVDPSPDLTNGRATLPVVHAQRVLGGNELDELLKALYAAQHDPSLHDVARAAVRDAGGVRYAALMAEVHVQRSLRLIRDLDLDPVTTVELVDRVASVSVLGGGAQAGSTPPERIETPS